MPNDEIWSIAFDLTALGRELEKHPRGSGRIQKDLKDKLDQLYRFASLGGTASRPESRERRPVRPGQKRHSYRGVL